MAPFVYCPDGQEEQDDPVPALYLSAWQLLQSPDASFDESLDHAARYLPLAHDLHPVCVVASVYWPAAHLSHAVFEPADDLYLPFVHGVQVRSAVAVPAVNLWPARQSVVRTSHGP